MLGGPSLSAFWFPFDASSTEASQPLITKHKVPSRFTYEQRKPYKVFINCSITWVMLQKSKNYLYMILEFI